MRWKTKDVDCYAEKRRVRQEMDPENRNISGCMWLEQ